MDLVTVALLLIVLILPILYLLRSYKNTKRISYLLNQLPGPPTYPVIGSAYDMLTAEREDLFYLGRKRVNRYGPLFRTWLGDVPNVHVMKARHLEVIMNNSIQINKGRMYDTIRPWLGNGLLTSTGAKWHRNRKLITPTFHFKILDNFVEVFAEKSKMLVDQLRAKADGKVFDIYPFITHCALDIICETAMGAQINAMTNHNTEYVQAIYSISNQIIQRSFRPWLHPNFFFNLSPMGRSFNKNVAILHSFTRKVIDDHKTYFLYNKNKKTESGEKQEVMGKKKRMAFLDLLLEISQDGKGLTDEEIREEVDTFMFEGHDTTTAGMCFALFLLGNNPDVQDKVVQELEDIFHGEDRSITTKDLGEMKYLERVIKESLRLYPSVPFIGRKLTQDIVLDDYVIPAGCTASLHIYDAHFDEEQFPDSERFDPDRFLPDRSQNRHPYAYIPFSAGPRNCIGQKFALLEEKAIISSIVRDYKIRSLVKQEDIFFSICT